MVTTGPGGDADLGPENGADPDVDLDGIEADLDRIERSLDQLAAGTYWDRPESAEHAARSEPEDHPESEPAPADR